MKSINLHNCSEKTACNLQCVNCKKSLLSAKHCLYCPDCDRKSLLVSQYSHSLNLLGPDDCFNSYSPWLPFQNVLNIHGPRIGCFHAEDLGQAIGLPDLWVVVSGYSPNHGSTFITGTFKECEAIGVLNRVREQTDKLLVVSSAGNAGRAFLELGGRHNEPAVVIMPERAMARTTLTALPEKAPLLILVRDAFYSDAIRLVDRLVERFSESLVREGGVYNVARRDSMAVPFLRAVKAIGGLPDRYVQAVGSGTGAIAAWESAQRLMDFGLVKEHTMSLLLVQNSPFSPMVDAWLSGLRDVTRKPEALLREQLAQTRASVLSNANPPYSVSGGVYDTLMASNGTMCAVTNDEIIKAQKLSKELLDFEPCDAASAALAGLVRSTQDGVVSHNERVLLHLTGGGLADLANRYGSFPYQRSVTVNLNDDDSAFYAVENYIANMKHF